MPNRFDLVKTGFLGNPQKREYTMETVVDFRDWLAIGNLFNINQYRVFSIPARVHVSPFWYECVEEFDGAGLQFRIGVGPSGNAPQWFAFTNANALGEGDMGIGGYLGGLPTASDIQIAMTGTPTTQPTRGKLRIGCRVFDCNAIGDVGAGVAQQDQLRND